MRDEVAFFMKMTAENIKGKEETYEDESINLIYNTIKKLQNRYKIIIILTN